LSRLGSIGGAARRAVLNNVGLKLLSLFIGFSMWLLVSSEQQVERILEVPVEIINKPASLEISNDFVKSVLVQIQASELGKDAAVKNLVATLDLRAAHEGENVIGLGPRNFRTPAGVKIVSIRPSTVTLVLEPLQRKTLPVMVKFSGQPAENFEVRGVMATPARVSIAGPSSHVRNYTELATQTVDISGLQQTLVQFVNLPVDSPFIDLEYSDKVRVEIRIQERMVPVILTRLPIQVRGVDGDYRLRRPTADARTSVPVSLKDRLTAEDVEIYIDGADCTPGAGFQEVPLRYRILNPTFANSLRVDRIVPEKAAIRVSGAGN
jgi:YbbR domain-containing protein